MSFDFPHLEYPTFGQQVEDEQLFLMLSGIARRHFPWLGHSRGILGLHHSLTEYGAPIGKKRGDLAFVTPVITRDRKRLTDAIGYFVEFKFAYLVAIREEDIAVDGLKPARYTAVYSKDRNIWELRTSTPIAPNEYVMLGYPSYEEP